MKNFVSGASKLVLKPLIIGGSVMTGMMLVLAAGTFTVNFPTDKAAGEKLNVGTWNDLMHTVNKLASAVTVDGNGDVIEPDADGKLATKGYVDDAIWGDNDFYLTDTVHDGVSAWSACAAGYHMCTKDEDRWALLSSDDNNLYNKAHWVNSRPFCNSWTDNTSWVVGRNHMALVNWAEGSGSGFARLEIMYSESTCNQELRVSCCID